MKNKKTIIGVVVVIVLLLGVVAFNDERIQTSLLDRIFSSDFHHEIRNKEAIQAAGIFGKGREEQRASFIRAPEQNTDSIFSFLVYEYGIFIGIAVILMYATLCMLILMLAYQSKPFEAFFAIGIAVLLFIQSSINIFFSLFKPITGEILPFLSNGGTAFFIWLVLFGFVFSIYRVL